MAMSIGTKIANMTSAQLAVAAQPGKAGQQRRSGCSRRVDSHAGRILSCLERTRYELSCFDRSFQTGEQAEPARPEIGIASDALVRIVVDVSPLSRPRTGIGNYLRGMLAGLAEAGGGEHELVAFAPSGPRGRGRINAALEGLPVELRLPLLPRAQWWRAGWSRLGRPPVESVAGPLDVFHFSDWMYPSQRGGVRATTVHDLVPARFPELVERGTRRMHSRKLDAVRSCDVVFANSRFTAGEAVELLGVPEERVVVAYPGVDPLFRPDGDPADLTAPYVLSVSTLEPRKNLPALVSAFALLRRRRPELTLALAGPAGWEERPLAAEGVRLLGFVPDEELARLY